jgi:hypothetical protein
VNVISIGEEPLRSTGPSFGEFVRTMACTTNAVLVVRLEAEESALTEEENFVFTDYTAAVEEISSLGSRASI